MTAIQIANGNSPSALQTCNPSGNVILNTCTINTTILASTTFQGYLDPNSTVSSTLCSKGSPVACNYTAFRPGGTGVLSTENLEVCAYIEGNVASFSGTTNISILTSPTMSSVALTAGCP